MHKLRRLSWYANLVALLVVTCVTIVSLFVCFVGTIDFNKMGPLAVVMTYRSNPNGVPGYRVDYSHHQVWLCRGQVQWAHGSNLTMYSTQKVDSVEYELKRLHPSFFTLDSDLNGNNSGFSVDEQGNVHRYWSRNNQFLGSQYFSKGSATESRGFVPAPPEPVWTKVSVLYWPLLLAWLVASLFFVWKRWWDERSRVKRGCCKHCGYDLRGTPNGCPECGKLALVK